MKELLEFIAKSMVSEPDAVSVEENVQENAVVLTLHVAEGDMGKVIGKQGITFRSPLRPWVFTICPISRLLFISKFLLLKII